MDAAIYYPIVRAKAGEIEALGHLSPWTRSRIRPLLDLPLLPPGGRRSLDSYLAETVVGIARNWGIRYPIFLDLSVYGPEVAVGDEPVVERLFDHARKNRLLAVPVAGPVIARGPGPRYVEAVGRIARADGRGVALRFHHADYAIPRMFRSVVIETLDILQIGPSDVDLYFDNEAIDLANDQPCDSDQLVSDVSRAIAAVADLGFRAMVVSGSSLPRSVGKRHDNNFAKIERAELRIWESVLAMQGSPVYYGDYGVVYPNEADPTKLVRVPARIRVSTPEAYHLWRAKRAEYASLARAVADDPAFKGDVRSWGASEILACAAGVGRVGGPRNWVARDTNRHIETTTTAIEIRMAKTGYLDRLAFAAPTREPWLQDILID